MNAFPTIKDVVSASERLRSYKYLPWEQAGGPEECQHGVAAGIPCRNCDAQTVYGGAA